MDKGSFVVSLDLELMWGVRDVTTKEEYGNSIIGVREVLPKMLDIFNEFQINATFSTVGFLFFESRQELLSMIPENKPNYKDSKLSPYSDINLIGENEIEDPYHYGISLIELIKKGNHEISTHTFSHYYCLEDGQDGDDFEDDIIHAINIAKKRGVELKSIIFPRNQFNSEYLQVCKKHGILSYRGNESSWIYKASKGDQQSLFKRFLRLADSYINITGDNIYDYKKIKQTVPLNISSSTFLRPYNKKLKFLDSLRLRRIKNAMTQAATKNMVFHLWWHPHNFGINQKENLLFLNEILKHYSVLKNKHSFQSITMNSLADKLLKEIKI